MRSVPWPRFRAEVLEALAPPELARASWFKLRRTLDVFEQSARPQGKQLTTADITPANVARFHRSHPEWRQATLKGNSAYLRIVVRFAMASGRIKVDPFGARGQWLRGAEPDEDLHGRTHLDPGEVGRLLDHLQARAETPRGARLYALTAVCAFAGLRAREAQRLAAKDIDLEQRIIRIKPRPGKRLKTAKSAAPVPIPDELAEILDWWLPRRGESPWAFPSARLTTPWTGGSPGYTPLDELRAAAVAAGIGKVTFLMLRHTWRTLSVRWGITPDMARRIMRHTSEKTGRDWYEHEDLEPLREAGNLVRFPRKKTGTG